MTAVYVIAAVLATVRCLGVKSALFQAAAHLYVGGLFGAYYADKDHRFLDTAIALSLVEVVCFLAFKYLV